MACAGILDLGSSLPSAALFTWLGRIKRGLSIMLMIRDKPFPPHTCWKSDSGCNYIQPCISSVHSDCIQFRWPRVVLVSMSTLTPRSEVVQLMPTDPFPLIPRKLVSNWFLALLLWYVVMLLGLFEELHSTRKKGTVFQNSPNMYKHIKIQWKHCSLLEFVGVVLILYFLNLSFKNQCWGDLALDSIVFKNK